MFKTLNTLFLGTVAREEEKLQDRFAIELIDQKIREAEAQHQAAKGQLALLIQRERSERRLKEQLTARHADLMDRARQALEAGKDDLAEEAASAIAQMENELAMRSKTLSRLESQSMRLQASVENGHRRIVDLKQGATLARSLRREQDMQRGLRGDALSRSAAAEAESLIARVIKQDDPFEQADIVAEIEAGLTHETLPDRLAAEGFGKAEKSTAASVLTKLKSPSNS